MRGLPRSCVRCGAPATRAARTGAERRGERTPGLVTGAPLGAAPATTRGRGGRTRPLRWIRGTHNHTRSVMPLTEAEVKAACSEPDPATKDFIMQHTMYRIKDPKASLDFYTRVLGMRLLKRLDLPAAKMSLFLMGYESGGDIPSDETERTRWCFSRRAVVELAHAWGTESDPQFAGYHSGNSEPAKGFGHIALEVPDVDAACARLEQLGVVFAKKPNEGLVKAVAFVKDPDGYWIEILNSTTLAGAF
ncbi:lactoylglutathione lyase-like [Pollicipes pollicipes]|uniref:lactoylglutathione lyase-like n=1 Tax=Pollicipes pollicipes TaxID=41117 RepID=UPI001884A112|nr:lactoylglutathione lyase-like [Pollicipes pollicipes]